MATSKAAAKSRAKLFEQAQAQLGISKINSPGEQKRILDLVMGFEEAQKSPTLQAVASSLGIQKFNTINDYMRVQQQLSAPKPPAAAPPPPPPAPAAPAAPAPSPDLERYRAEAQSYMQQADAILNQFRIDQSNATAAAAAQRAKDEESRKLQEQLAIRSQAAMSANMARSQMTPNLQIQPASGTPQTAGTQGFKRRQSQATTPIQTMSGINVPTSNFLNV